MSVGEAPHEERGMALGTFDVSHWSIVAHVNLKKGVFGIFGPLIPARRRIEMEYIDFYLEGMIR